MSSLQVMAMLYILYSCAARIIKNKVEQSSLFVSEEKKTLQIELILVLMYGNNEMTTSSYLNYYVCPSNLIGS